MEKSYGKGCSAEATQEFGKSFI